MAELSQKLHVKNGSIIQEVTLYSTPEEATPTNGSYGEITFNGVTGYVALWDKSIPGGDNHTPVTVKKNNVEYWLDCIVAISNTRTLTLPATEHQTITLNYTDPEDETMQTITSTDTVQEITVKYGTTWTATVAAAIGYTAGTLSASSGTVTEDVELTITEATMITFDLTLAATENQTITLTYTEPDKEAQTVTSTNTAQTITVDYGTTWTATVTAAEGYAAGTLSASSGTVTAATTVSATEAEGSINPKTSFNLDHYASNHHLDPYLTTLPQTNINELTNIALMESAESAFNNYQYLTSLSNVEQTWDTSNVRILSHMFESCSSLTSLDVSNWDTSSANYFGNMFDYCSSLTSLDVSNWNTSNVTDTDNMFGNCSSLTSLDLSNWNTSNIREMNEMFIYCSKLEVLDVSNWDTSNVSKMNNIFVQCNKLQYLIIGSSTFKFIMKTPSYGLNTTCKILVPNALLDTFKTANYWSSHASQFDTIENYTITRSNGQVTVTPKS